MRFAFEVSETIEFFLLVDQFADRELDQLRSVDSRRRRGRVVVNRSTRALCGCYLLEEEFGAVEFGEDLTCVEWTCKRASFRIDQTDVRRERNDGLVSNGAFCD